ncbi:MAG: PD40 domain-containing protein [Gemmatimonadaceae bacterium]|nr:PD40 domain-containing protein [Gemmatimonadaceae bacterium]
MSRTSIALLVAILGRLPVALAGQQAGTEPPAALSNGAYPIVSPSGRWILFTSERDGTPDVYVMRTSGRDVRRLTYGPERELPVGWSHDRPLFGVFAQDSTTLFAGRLNGSTSAIARVPGRGVQLTPEGNRVLHTVGTFRSNRLVESDLDGGNPRFITHGGEAIFNPRLSTDGKLIAYTRMDSTGTLEIWVARRDGSGTWPVVRHVVSAGRPQVPAWSPDGTRIAFQVNVQVSSTPPQSTSQIWLVEIATGGLVSLAGHERVYLDEVPSWFPDGRHLAFQSNRTGRMEVWVMRTDGMRARQLTRE